MEKLSKNFSAEEFFCKCGLCPKKYPHEVLIDTLQNVRRLTDIPMVITSGVRCEKYNKQVGGMVGSRHVHGLAADIECNNGIDRFILIREFMKQPKIRGIGVYRQFIHIDVKTDKRERKVIWGY